MRLVIIESPYAGEVARNLRYLTFCLRDSILRGESPYASHAFIPNVLSEESERELGIACGYAWWDAAEAIIFYIDLGWSPGMQRAIQRAIAIEKPYEERSLANSPDR